MTAIKKAAATFCCSLSAGNLQGTGIGRELIKQVIKADPEADVTMLLFFRWMGYVRWGSIGCERHPFYAPDIEAVNTAYGIPANAPLYSNTLFFSYALFYGYLKDSLFSKIFML